MFTQDNNNTEPTADNNSKNFYDILGVRKNATAEEIRKAYKMQSVKKHPDKNPGNDTTELFKEVGRAYAILSDPVKRSNYDKDIGISTASYAAKSAATTPESSQSALSVDLSTLSDLVKNNKLAEIKEIIQQAKILKDWRWKYTQEDVVECAVRDAILLQLMDIVKLFLDEGVSANTLAPAKKEMGQCYFIHFAVESGNLEMVKLLVERGADIAPYDSWYKKGNDHGITAAVKFGHADIVAYLLEKGAATDGMIGKYFRDRDTFLVHAAKHDRIEIIELLMHHAKENKIVKSLMFANRKCDKRIKIYEAALNREYSDQQRQKLVNRISAISSHWHDYYESELKKFDEMKSLFETKLQTCKNVYYKIVKTLMDYAIGVDFSTKDRYRGLEFLNSLETVAGINFIGVSVDDKPITHDMLAAKKLNGAEEAIITLDDLKKIADLSRRTAIQKRIEHGQIEIAEELIVNQLNNKGDALLHEAVRDGDVDEVKKLLAQGANVNLKGSEGYPLYMAATYSYIQRDLCGPSKKHITILQILLNHHADPNLSYNDSTAMNAAGRAGSAEALAILLPITKKCDIVMGEERFPWYTQIMFDSYRSEEWFEILKLLKTYGADFNGTNEYKSDTLLRIVMRIFPPLSTDYSKMCLIEQLEFLKHLQLLDFILANGADPNLKSEGDTALHVFIEKNNLDHVQGGYAKVIDKCLAKGFDINSTDDYDRTLLHLAASDGKLQAVKYLLARGANIDALDKDGRSPLYYAAVGKCLEVKSAKEKIAKFISDTQTYVDSFSDKESNKSVLEKLNITNDDHKLLLENYQDEVSHEIMEIPVVLNERVYDLKTLLDILEKDKKDPFSGAAFELSDIEPASQVANEIKMLIQYFEEKYPLSITDNNNESNLKKQGLFANNKRKINADKHSSYNRNDNKDRKFLVM